MTRSPLLAALVGAALAACAAPRGPSTPEHWSWVAAHAAVGPYLITYPVPREMRPVDAASGRSVVQRVDYSGGYTRLDLAGSYAQRVAGDLRETRFAAFEFACRPPAEGCGALLSYWLLELPGTAPSETGFAERVRAAYDGRLRSRAGVADGRRGPWYVRSLREGDQVKFSHRSRHVGGAFGVAVTVYSDENADVERICREAAERMAVRVLE